MYSMWKKYYGVDFSQRQSILYPLIILLCNTTALCVFGFGIGRPAYITTIIIIIIIRSHTYAVTSYHVYCIMVTYGYT